MNIARKPFILILIFLLIFLLLYTIFSNKGILVNFELQKELQRIEKIEEEKKINILSLNNALEQSTEVEILDDIAFSLGYNNEGDEVYYFDSPDILDDEEHSSKEDIKIELNFNGFNTLYIALASSVITLMIVFIVYKCTKEKEEEEKEERNYNYDDL